MRESKRELRFDKDNCSSKESVIYGSRCVNSLAIQREIGIEDEIIRKSNSCATLEASQRSMLQTLLLNSKEIFYDGNLAIPNYSFKIQLFNDEYFKCKYYPIPKHYVEEVRGLIKEMVQHGIIRKQQTAYINPIVLVKKKNNSLRLCIDARQLNSRTIPYRDVPPRVDEIISNFNGAKYFTSLDLRNSYWQIRIDPESQKYTGFVFEGCTYVFERVPFGLKNSDAGLNHC